VTCGVSAGWRKLPGEEERMCEGRAGGMTLQSGKDGVRSCLLRERER